MNVQLLIWCNVFQMLNNMLFEMNLKNHQRQERQKLQNLLSQVFLLLFNWIFFCNTFKNRLMFSRYYGIFETDNMRGFYISTYEDENNRTSYLVLTKFEPVHSRHAFPCLDEPQYKATFVLSLTYPTGLNALGNTPISSNSTIDT